MLVIKTNDETHSIAWEYLFWAIDIQVVTFAIDLGISTWTKKLLHTKVKRGVQPKDLVEYEYYHLNGRTMAVYQGQDPDTGKYIFRMTINGDYVYTHLEPKEVREYISKNEEK